MPFLFGTIRVGFLPHKILSSEMKGNIVENDKQDRLQNGTPVNCSADLHITQIMAVCFALAVTGCATQKAQTSSSVELGVYTIQAGDTFAKIAKTHHLTIRQLKELNPDAMPAHLKIGQKLYVLPQASS